MSAHDILMAASGASTDKLYVDDVFSTYLYTGNSSTQTINNGIDLAGKGGMVWIKQRSTPVTHHILFDTAQTSSWNLSSNQTAGKHANTTGFAFTSSGFSLGAPTGYEDINQSGKDNVSWTFRKAPKFFDVVTYTGNGTVTFINHSLGVSPGMVIVKRVNSTSDWAVWHRSTSPANEMLRLNTFDGIAGTTGQMQQATASSIIVVSSAAPYDMNTSGDQYVAYLFAHDTSTDGIIQCGSFTGNTTTTLGWEPQFVMLKRADAAGDWMTIDSMRGCSVGGVDMILSPNLSSTEVTTNDYIDFTATGFISKNLTGTYVYMTVRRSNKPPTSGVQVFYAEAKAQSNIQDTSGVPFPPDLCVTFSRNGTDRIAPYSKPNWFTRLIGMGTPSDMLISSNGTPFLISAENTAESTTPSYFNLKADGKNITRGSGWDNMLYGSRINHFFKRAPGVFDIVSFIGNSDSQVINHSLGVMPELIIRKARTGTTNANWDVMYVNPSTPNIQLTGMLDQTQGLSTNSGLVYTTATTFTTFGNVVVNGVSAITYLFATKAGVSKVGSYTGNGGTQTINCGFTTGARFIMIKRTDFVGDWYVWDTARGIVASNDPHLSLNISTAEVTTDDSIDPASTGFIVNQLAATNVNVSAATYIYLAFA